MRNKLISNILLELCKSKGFNFIQKIICNDDEDEWEQNGVSQSLLQKWLRENYKIEVFVIPAYDKIDDFNTLIDISTLDQIEYYCLISNENAPPDDRYDIKIYADTYEEALEEGLYQALLLI